MRAFPQWPRFRSWARVCLLCAHSCARACATSSDSRARRVAASPRRLSFDEAHHLRAQRVAHVALGLVLGLVATWRPGEPSTTNQGTPIYVAQKENKVTPRLPVGTYNLSFCSFCQTRPKESALHASERASWVEKKTPWTTLVSLCLSIGQYRFFFLCIGLQCIGSSGSKVATFPYKCSMRSTLCQLPAPAGNRNFQYKCSTQSTFWQLQLESSNFSVVVCAGHFGSSGSKVAAFQCKKV